MRVDQQCYFVDYRTIFNFWCDFWGRFGSHFGPSLGAFWSPRITLVQHLTPKDQALRTKLFHKLQSIPKKGARKRTTVNAYVLGSADGDVCNLKPASALDTVFGLPA